MGWVVSAPAVLRGLDDGHAMMDAHMVVALSDVMVTSMVGLTRVFTSIYNLETGRRKTATSETCVGGVTWSKCLVGLGSCLSKGRLGGLWIWPVR